MRGEKTLNTAKICVCTLFASLTAPDSPHIFIYKQFDCKEFGYSFDLIQLEIFKMISGSLPVNGNPNEDLKKRPFKWSKKKWMHYTCIHLNLYLKISIIIQWKYCWKTNKVVLEVKKKKKLYINFIIQWKCWKCHTLLVDETKISNLE